MSVRSLVSARRALCVAVAAVMLSAAAASPARADAEQRFQAGVNAAAAGDTANAARHWLDAARLGHGRAHFELGRLRVDARQMAEAYRWLRAAAFIEYPNVSGGGFADLPDSWLDATNAARAGSSASERAVLMRLEASREADPQISRFASEFVAGVTLGMVARSCDVITADQLGALNASLVQTLEYWSAQYEKDPAFPALAMLYMTYVHVLVTEGMAAPLPLNCDDPKHARLAADLAPYYDGPSAGRTVTRPVLSNDRLFDARQMTTIRATGLRQAEQWLSICHPWDTKTWSWVRFHRGMLARSVTAGPFQTVTGFSLFDVFSASAGRVDPAMTFCESNLLRLPPHIALFVSYLIRFSD